MHVIFLRHATRDAQGPDDGGLNPIGQRQAEALVAKMQPRGPLPRPTHLLASPKRRTRETLAPIAATFGLSVTVVDALDERRHDESAKFFLQRIRGWVESSAMFSAPNIAVYVCSHLDWLTEVLYLLPADLTENELGQGFMPGEFRIFEIRDGVWYTIPGRHKG